MKLLLNDIEIDFFVVVLNRQRSVRGHYRCTITVLNKDIKVSATANTKKGAKNAAARAVLEKLNRRIEEIEK